MCGYVCLCIYIYLFKKVISNVRNISIKEHILSFLKHSLFNPFYYKCKTILSRIYLRNRDTEKVTEKQREGKLPSVVHFPNS